MKKNRYDVSGLVEAQFEPGSKKKVLKNLLGIKTKRKMDRLEAKALEQLEDFLVRKLDKNHQFQMRDISEMHRIWFGKIYPWAGQFRKVKLTRDNFSFSFPAQIPALMVEFEKNILRTYTPCSIKERDRIIKALAEVHTEFILIHPFREGNGRIGRLLATLMALQADLPQLNFKPITKGKGKKEYFAAVQAGLSKNYEPMERIFSLVVQETEKSNR